MVKSAMSKLREVFKVLKVVKSVVSQVSLTDINGGEDARFPLSYTHHMEHVAG